MNFKGKSLIFLLLLMLTLVVAGCAETQEGEQVEQETPAGAAAVVNGEVITEEEFNELVDKTAQAYEQEGMDIQSEETQQTIKENVLDTLINQRLLLQKAEEQNLIASEEEVNAEYEQIVTGFESEEQFNVALEENNFTPEQLRKELKNEISINKLIDQELPQVEVTEEELQEKYEQFASQDEVEDVPPFEELRELIEETIKQEKQEEGLQQYLEQIKEQSEIQRYV